MSVFVQNISVLRESLARDIVIWMCCYKLERPASLVVLQYELSISEKSNCLCPLTLSHVSLMLCWVLLPFPQSYEGIFFAFPERGSLGSLFGGADILESVLWRWNLFWLEQSVSLLISLGFVCCLAMKSRHQMNWNEITRHTKLLPILIKFWMGMWSAQPIRSI